MIGGKKPALVEVRRLPQKQRHVQKVTDGELLMADYCLRVQMPSRHQENRHDVLPAVRLRTNPPVKAQRNPREGNIDPDFP